MTIKSYKPKTPGLRQATVNVVPETKREPERRLTKGKKRKGGRNSQGRMTSRHRGGGAKKAYRRIDFYRNKDDIPARVAALEYDPNRGANIALLNYVDGEKRYILAPAGLKVGQEVLSGSKAQFKPGHTLTLEKIPTGMEIHNIEMQPGSGGRLVRGAGMAAQIRSKEGCYAQVLLPSGEIREINTKCRATIGRVGNQEHEDVVLGKAGRTRHSGRRPHVRGVVMNPVDHPMGGGEGRSSGGGHPVSPWSWHTKGARTRKKKKPSTKFIVKRRDS